jgi:hypothetical protein
MRRILKLNVVYWRKFVMSVKTKSNLLIIGAVAVGLLAGTVLLSGYANILPGGSGGQSPICQAGGGTSCGVVAANACSTVKAQSACAQEAGAGFDANACPMGRSEPCCAGDATESACGKPCPADCTKPCCAGEAAPGCCPKPDASAAESCCSG